MPARPEGVTKRLVVFALLVVLGMAAVAFLAPAPVAALACVQCPVIEDPQCPPCYQLLAQTCNHCAYCKKIRGCK